MRDSNGLIDDFRCDHTTHLQVIAQGLHQHLCGNHLCGGRDRWMHTAGTGTIQNTIDQISGNRRHNRITRNDRAGSQQRIAGATHHFAQHLAGLYNIGDIRFGDLCGNRVANDGRIETEREAVGNDGFGGADIGCINPPAWTAPSLPQGSKTD